MFSSGCRRGILALGSGGGFNPQTLFASGEQGGWWDPSDFSTLFQDSAGTTPVTAVTQPVGKILDKSGRGNHRTQATAGSRPTLQVDASGFFYLNYDGVDDGMATGNVDFTATNKATIWSGVQKPSDATGFGTVVELGTSVNAVDGTFALFAPGTIATASYGCYVRGTTTTCNFEPTTYTAPISNVISIALDTAGAARTDQVKPRINGVLNQTGGGGLTVASNFINAPMYFGRRSGTTLPFTGREYATIVLGRTATVGEIAQGERFIGSRMGIAL